MQSRNYEVYASKILTNKIMRKRRKLLQSYSRSKSELGSQL